MGPPLLAEPTASGLYSRFPGGTVTTVYSFCSQPNCTDGDDVAAGLTQATDGDFYGTTGFGGNIDCEYPNGCGTVFRVTAGGALRTLHTFELVDGDEPRGTLLQATDGNFYGTTSFGGNHLFGHINLLGTVFRITAGGKLTTLYNFGGPDGDSPFGGLTQGTDGNFYGTTSFGGDPTCNAPHGCGTVFRITPTGTLTTLHRFEMTDGALPAGGLIQATNGNFYGTTNGGYLCGAACGTVFMITPGGSLTTLHNFNGADGSEPNGGLVQATSGVFYGTTGSGGTNGSGTVFSLSTGLEPFVALVRSSGKIGQTGGILGQGFTGTTSVSLNGTPAAFTVASDTYITATIPPGATTGYVTVTTPSGTLTSNVRFRVLR